MERINELLSDKDFSLIFLDMVDSTNIYAKNLSANGAEEYTVVIAESQTMGKGRLDRKFLSESGKGIYFTVILRPQFDIREINAVTLLSALAVSDTVFELTGKRVSIKWPNDIYLDNKKLCGILTESAVAPDGKPLYVIVGIGVNLLQKDEEFPPEIRDIATSVFAQTGVKVDRAEFLATLLKNFKELYECFPNNKKDMLLKYSENLFCKGERIRVIELENSYEAVLKDVDENGYLLVEVSGKEKKVIGGEISIRPL